MSADSTLLKSNSDKRGDPEMKGWLLKWTNYIKGYQKRWFVLSKGVLSYYRNQAEINHTCRGTIYIVGALIYTVDSCTFVISNGGTQTFHIKAANEVERQSWVTALELAKAKAIRAMEYEEEEEVVTAHVVPSQEINTVVRDLTERLENLRTCYDLITKHGVALQRALSDLETNDEEALSSRIKIVNERATLFRITSNAMINACSDYLRTAESQGQKWSKMLQHERENKQRLEEIVEQLAKQQSQLEQAAQLVRAPQSHHKVGNSSNAIANDISSPIVTSDDDDNEFFDAEETCFAVEESPQDDDFTMQVQRNRKASDENPNSSSSSENEENKKKNESIHVVSSPQTNEEEQQEDVAVEDAVDHSAVTLVEDSQLTTLAQQNSKNKILKKRRTRVPDKPHYPLNLWSIMKNCIGKELSKIPMPVNFNEPLSMLQRLVEDYEYSDLLDVAATMSDECEQLAYVAAFTISSYSTTASRTGKPFNPLLGETYECDRTDDLGWRCIAEQVSHHPPMAAFHCEAREWICWQEFTMTSKFRGKYLQVIPLGGAHVIFQKNNAKYTWRKVTTTVNNIIVGKLWVDQQGEMEITGLNGAAGIKCLIKYIPYSYFSRDAQRRVKGVVMDRNDEVKWVLRGFWDSKIEIAPVLSTSKSSDGPVYKTGNYRTIWNRRMPDPESEKYYNFTRFACQLNEMEDGIAPTDSRHRPDQRLMELGRWDESNKEKVRLEEKQRAKRRMQEAEAEKAADSGRPYPPYEPIWFAREKEEGTDNIVHVYKGTYWEAKSKQDWSNCPDIF